MAQIDIVNSRATPLVQFGYGVNQLTGTPPGQTVTPRTEYFGRAITTTHDSTRGTASASLPVSQVFALPNERVDFAIYGGVTGTAFPEAFRGTLTSESQQYYIQGETLTLTGHTRLLSEPLGRAKAFYYNGGTPEETANLLSFVPEGWQAVPIMTDADLIIHLLESYNITPLTTNHSIEQSNIPVARLMPILITSTDNGWALIQELDRISAWRTFDAPNGAINRRQLYGVTPATVTHTFTQGVDIIDVQRSLHFKPFNVVEVTGAFSESYGANVWARTPVNDVEIVPGPWIHDPPGRRVFSIESELIETQAVAQLIADQWYPIVNTPFDEFQVVTFLGTDFEVGGAYGVNCHLLTANCYCVAHTADFAAGTSTLTLRVST